MNTISTQKALKKFVDYAQASRQDFIAQCSDPYAEKRESAIQWLRERGLYALDKDSREYTPAYARGPQAMVQLRTAL